MMQKQLWLLLVASVVLVCIAAAPAMAFTGSLTGGNGVGIWAPTDGAIHNPWDSPLTVFSWDVTRVGSSWRYRYDVTAPEKNFSHILIETSLDASITDLIGATYEGPRTWSPSDPGNSDPGLPGDIYGFKFSPSAETTHFVWEFDSVRSPAWGRFYAKDGVKGTGLDPRTNVVMWNRGFLLADPSVAVGSFGPNESPNWMILRPDTVIGGTPELPAWLLLCCSAFVGAVLRRKRKAA